MKKISIRFMLVFLLLFTLSTCSPKANLDIRGTWDYTMTAENGGVYDIGTITFDGSETKGNYTQLNIYDVEYEGNYTVSGAELKLTGYENWQGTLNNANSMSGTWQHDDGSSGTFEAAKK